LSFRLLHPPTGQNRQKNSLKECVFDNEFQPESDEESFDDEEDEDEYDSGEDSDESGKYIRKGLK